MCIIALKLIKNIYQKRFLLPVACFLTSLLYPFTLRVMGIPNVIYLYKLYLLKCKSTYLHVLKGCNKRDKTNILFIFLPANI